VKSTRYLHFSAFCLDRVGEQLWQGTEILLLRRKPFAVLRYLMEHAREVVTKDALLTALWPNVHVSEEVLTVHLREVRKVLGDDAHTPRFIETVHGRGYRFIKPVVSSQWLVVSNQKTGGNRLQLATGNWQLTW
jgi:DNA-binding winged helix-turn-helix (wHTH) protein